MTFDSFLASTAGCFLLGIQSSRRGLEVLGCMGFGPSESGGFLRALKGFVFQNKVAEFLGFGGLGF